MVATMHDSRMKQKKRRRPLLLCPSRRASAVQSPIQVSAQQRSGSQHSPGVSHHLRPFRQRRSNAPHARIRPSNNSWMRRTRGASPCSLLRRLHSKATPCEVSARKGAHTRARVRTLCLCVCMCTCCMSAHSLSRCVAPSLCVLGRRSRACPSILQLPPRHTPHTPPTERRSPPPTLLGTESPPSVRLASPRSHAAVLSTGP